MKGFVPTPQPLVDVMVDKLFAIRSPQEADTLLDPGCGEGVFIEGVLRWCARAGAPVPNIVGIDSDPVLVAEARRRLGDQPRVSLRQQDFLLERTEPFDYIVGNPPYVAITALTVRERETYRSLFRSAVGRFDLYLLFFEQSIRMLKPRGRLVFVTPEKFLYVQTASPLRRAMAEAGVEEIELVEESVFDGLVTYPTITTMQRAASSNATRVLLRDGTVRQVRLSNYGSWMPLLNGGSQTEGRHTISEVFDRISCGVATGADDVFVLRDADIPAGLQPFAVRTVSGRQLKPGNVLVTNSSMLIPYDNSGELLSERELGSLGEYLREPDRHARLLRRTCVTNKPWYAFHETPPMSELLRPKILCKDIGTRPSFVVDEIGNVVPRHSVYYLVPRDVARIQELCDYLNSQEALDWLMQHCQRAANGFIRLQSHVLKQMPLPEHLALDQLACM